MIAVRCHPWGQARLGLFEDLFRNQLYFRMQRSRLVSEKYPTELECASVGLLPYNLTGTCLRDMPEGYSWQVLDLARLKEAA